MGQGKVVHLGHGDQVQPSEVEAAELQQILHLVRVEVAAENVQLWLSISNNWRWH